MTTPHHDSIGTATTPPPGCPAHAQGESGLRKLYGAEAEAEPYALYEQLRKEFGAVAPVAVHGDIPVWLVLGHREIQEVLRAPKLFSSDSTHWSVMSEGRLSADSPLLPMVYPQPLVCFADGEAHGRLRSAVTESLERFNRRGMRGHVRRYANQLIDGFGASGQADLVTDFAEKLPALVICALFGIREDDALTLGRAVADMVSGSANAQESNEFVVDVLRRLVEEKKAQPGEDFTSWLIAHESDLTDEEVWQHVRHALVAALENTVNLLASTLRMVLTDRRFRGSLSGGAMTLPDALEQVLWDHPPLAVLPNRWATGDTRLGEQQIKKGDMVMLCLAAGNMDPEIRPDLSAPVHGNRSHVAFASGSPHECPGQDIGRAIADSSIDVLLRRLPDMEFAGHETDLEVVGNWISRRLARLPVRFTPLRVEGDVKAPETSPAIGAELPAAVAQPETARQAEPAAAPRVPWLQRVRRALGVLRGR